MSDTNDLIRAANKTAAAADALSERFARELAKVFRQTDRALRDWLAQQTQTRLPFPSARLAIRSIVQNSGFTDLARVATNQPFNEIAATTIAARRAAGVAVDATVSAAMRLEGWKQWHLDDLLIEGSVLSRSLGDAVMRGFGRSTQLLPGDLSDILDASESRIQTLYDTAVSIYGRQVEAEQAGEDPSTSFVYMGPVDAKTRDFCLAHVGNVYTREEIDALDNGQLSNVFLTGGGYNCRHVWQEISKASELYTSGHAPEIRDAVAEIRKAA